MYLFSRIKVEKQSHFINKSDLWFDFNVIKHEFLDFGKKNSGKLHKYFIIDFGIKKFPINIVIRLWSVK